MSSTQTKVLSIFAPAKLNLYLHVTGRLDNGYHTLDSLIAFADIGDTVEIAPAPDFSFEVKGPYSSGFTTKEQDASPDSSNLLVQAVWSVARAAQKTPDVHVTLTKNLPLASGLGGGSADAAAVIWGLLELWEIPASAPHLPGLMLHLGADVPVCLSCRPTRVRGIGDILDPGPNIGENPIVLVNPGKPCPTQDVFAHYYAHFKEPQALPENLERYETLVDFLKHNENDLHKAAAEIVPEIENVKNSLNAQKGCGLARLSGSGATCFGLFEHETAAKLAAQTIAQENPDWWVKSGWLGRPARY